MENIENHKSEDAMIPGKGIKFIPYNTGMPVMPLPEYGRNIQNMVDYCVEIPDRNERTACAAAIIEVMRSLFPQQVGEKGDVKKFWDHLNIMARFELDIDFPVEVTTADELRKKPSRLPYNTSIVRFRHYGRSLEGMVRIVADMEDGPEKDELISLCAHQMKKMMLTHNPEGVENSRIINDLNEFSGGKINLDPQTYVLRDFQDVTPAKNVRKGKKKKNNSNF